MTNTRKLRVIVPETCVDNVLRNLCDEPLQIIDIRDQLDSWNGLLEPHEVEVELSDRCSTLLSRVESAIAKINHLVELTENKPSGKSASGPILRGSSESVIAQVEQRFIDLDEKITLNEKRWTEIHSNLNNLLEELQSLLKQLEAPAPLSKHLLEKKVSKAEEHLEKNGGNDKKGLREKFFFSEKQKGEIEGKISEMRSLFSEIREDLFQIAETLCREKILIETRSQFGKTAKTSYFEAYVPDDNIDEIVAKIKDASGGCSVLVDEHPSADENVPITGKLAPNFLVAFEKLTLTTGYPSATEVNPIPIMAITFPILFGIMFADIGHGILFTILGITFTYVKRKCSLEKVGDIIRYILTCGELFFFLGISSIFFGFLFGEFFGPSGVIHPVSLGKLGPFYFGGFEPTQEPIRMLRLAVFIGVVHLSLGLVIRAIDEFKKSHHNYVIITGSWLWLLLGGFYMWIYWGGISNISIWFGEGLFMFGGLIVLPLLIIIVFTGIAESFTESIGFGVEVFAETLSHTLSYGRLLALNLAHSIMSGLFLELGGVGHGNFPVTSIPIIAIGTILVMTIEGLIVFVHTLRLHWIEWFSKFFTGEGRVFKPLYDTIHPH